MIQGKLNNGIQNIAVILIAVLVILPFTIGDGIIT